MHLYLIFTKKTAYGVKIDSPLAVNRKYVLYSKTIL